MKRFFPYVHVWPGKLGEDLPLRDIKATDITAVASLSPISMDDLLSRVSQPAITISKPLDIAFVSPSEIKSKAGQEHTIIVRVRNNSDYTLRSLPPFPIDLSYHIVDENGENVFYEGRRGSFTMPLLPGGETDIELEVFTELAPGTYTLELTIVQEYIQWWDEFLETPKIRLKLS